MTGLQPQAEADETEWLDKMVTKLQTELERQLNAVTKAQGLDDTPASRAADARTLSALERTLERLAKLERERAAVHEKKIARHDKGGRAALERRLDKLAGAAKPRRAAGKPG